MNLLLGIFLPDSSTYCFRYVLGSDRAYTDFTGLIFVDVDWILELSPRQLLLIWITASGMGQKTEFEDHTSGSDLVLLSLYFE